MNKFLVCLNIFFVTVIAWQNWTINDISNDRDWAWERSDFWHNECAHWKIHGKESYKI